MSSKNGGYSFHSRPTFVRQVFRVVLADGPLPEISSVLGRESMPPNGNAGSVQWMSNESHILRPEFE